MPLQNGDERRHIAQEKFRRKGTRYESAKSKGRKLQNGAGPSIEK